MKVQKTAIFNIFVNKVKDKPYSLESEKHVDFPFLSFRLSAINGNVK
jgi:hypothetical protein